MPPLRASTLTPANGMLPATSGLLKERAYTELKRRITTGDYAPGCFLAERQLAEDLGMSKTPVKAALERLEHEGFITISPQQGIVVRSLSIAEIADQYEIRMALESFTVRMLAGKLTPLQVAQVRANLTTQKKLTQKPDVLAAVKLDAEFHQLFIELLGNQEILAVMVQLRDKMGMVISTVFQSHPHRFESSYEEHLAISDAVIAGDGLTAAKLIEAHLEYGKMLILTRRPR